MSSFPGHRVLFTHKTMVKKYISIILRDLFRAIGSFISYLSFFGLVMGCFASAIYQFSWVIIALDPDPKLHGGLSFPGDDLLWWVTAIFGYPTLVVMICGFVVGVLVPASHSVSIALAHTVAYFSNLKTRVELDNKD